MLRAVAYAEQSDEPVCNMLAAPTGSEAMLHVASLTWLPAASQLPNASFNTLTCFWQSDASEIR